MVLALEVRHDRGGRRRWGSWTERAR